jgi:hypothetical protein
VIEAYRRWSSSASTRCRLAEAAAELERALQQGPREAIAERAHALAERLRALVDSVRGALSAG